MVLLSVLSHVQVEEDLADAVREQRQAEAEAEAEARCAEAAAMSAEAALQRLKEDAEKAEAAALAARAKVRHCIPWCVVRLGVVWCEGRRQPLAQTPQRAIGVNGWWREERGKKSRRGCSVMALG